VVIPNPQGLHARPAMQFVTVASHFKSHIRVRKGDTWANGKDPMDMMLLASPKGTELELIAEGEDAAGMLDALATLVVNGFGEM
jgi:phosphotransferase system HPr (HPr) family protein